MHPYPGNWLGIGHMVVYYAWAAREFSAGIKCRHCNYSDHAALHTRATALTVTGRRLVEW